MEKLPSNILSSSFNKDIYLLFTDKIEKFNVYLIFDIIIVIFVILYMFINSIFIKTLYISVFHYIIRLCTNHKN